jgi:hypothetical protein
MEQSNTLGILKQLERGEIDANQAEARLNAAAPAVERDYEPRFETEAPQWIRRLWMYPLTVGLLMVGFGAWVIVATVDANILWWLVGLPIVLLGTFVIALSASAPWGHWLYVSVQNAERHTFRIGIPLPLGLARVALWVAQWVVPLKSLRFGESRVGFDDWNDITALLDAFERELNEKNGIAVQVDDEERVQVYIA